ncbi:hypothetical protein SYNPS1DRAFT_30131 [Syncephalis pseudoplumigaleata]|uniref:Pentacotripeptide-repeat region of PRORP domain-containing protein n=1 Tax=Syncephalis pseudoplumigaleata TaxID=1712513 RepID=A0A4P9YVL0_9FUNG|nr:hypothetical protein SYNPS1DRAFT_30131 [Syncephalis pseudoplumigaleata]|eukprot:RKP24103.1 hypothetical protein SYNPS1DRAFT_30131 [Syncephalis pseudoplumigaleata]
MYSSVARTLWLHYARAQRPVLLGSSTPLVNWRGLPVHHPYVTTTAAAATARRPQGQQPDASSLSRAPSLDDVSMPYDFIEDGEMENTIAATKRDHQHAHPTRSSHRQATSAPISEEDYGEWRAALKQHDPIQVWEAMQPFVEERRLASTPTRLMEDTFRLMYTHGTSTYYNVVQNSTKGGREQPLFDCFLDALFRHKVKLFKWELIVLWMQRERERGRPLRILSINRLVSHRIMLNRTAIRGVALEETIMAAAQIDPRLMELSKSGRATKRNDPPGEDAAAIGMKHPARNMPILRNMVLCALSPAVRLSSAAWCVLLEWTAFRVPPVVPRLLEKAGRDGFVLSGALGERLLVGSTLREPYSLPVIYQLYQETTKAGGRPNRRSVSRLMHLLLKPDQSAETGAWSREERLKMAYDIFRQELSMGHVPHASANRLLISQLVGHGRHFEAEHVYNECRSKDQGRGRQSLIYSAMIQSYVGRRLLHPAKRVLDEMVEDTLRRHPNPACPSIYTVTGPRGEPTAVRLRSERDIELYNSSLEEESGPSTATGKTVVCTLWPHAQAAGVLIDAYGRHGGEHYYRKAEQLYEELTTQWGIYHEFLAAAMMRVYLSWKRPERALRLATDALDCGAHIDIWMLAAQVQGLSMLGRMDEAEDRLDAFMRTGPASMGAHHLQRVYHALALGYAQQGKLDAVRRIYAQMRAQLRLSAPLPDTWTAHMIAAAQRDSVADVCAVRKELEESGYILGDQNYAIALLVFAKQQQLALAQEWFAHIEASQEHEDKGKRVAMTGHIITAMLQAYTRAGRSKEGYAFWREMRTRYLRSSGAPARIDNALLSVLLDMSGRGLTTKETEEIWKMATTADRVQVNGNNGAALVEAYMRHGELDKAVHTMKRYRNDPNMHGMGVMLGGLRTRCEQQGRHDLVDKLDAQTAASG